MNLRKLTLALSAVIPAVAMFGGTAFAGGDAQPATLYTNLVVNGTFSTDTDGWTPSQYASASSKEGNALVYNTVPVAAITTTHEVTQCIEIEPNSRPTFRGSIYIPDNQVRTGSASFKLTYFKNDDCTSFKGNSQVPALVTTGHWRTTEFTLDPLTAKDAKSVLIAMQVTKNHTTPKNRAKKFVAIFDNIKLLAKVDPIQPDDDKGKCEHICVDVGGDDAPPPPPAVEPDDSEDEPAVEAPADMPADDEAPADDSADLPDAADQDADAETEDTDDDSGDAPSAPGAETPANPGSGESNQPGTGENPSTPGATPSTDKPVEATSNGDAKVIGGQNGKPASGNDNGGTASKTPLAPETGSNVQSEEGTTSTALFGGVAAGMATLGLLFAIILMRRSNRREA